MGSLLISLQSWLERTAMSRSDLPTLCLGCIQLDILDLDRGNCSVCARREVAERTAWEQRKTVLADSTKARPVVKPTTLVKIEHSPDWDRGDVGVECFYAYVLKLDGGEFYAGHTRELPPRLMEHRDGKVLSTSGRNPQLVWFREFGSRDQAARFEAELKAKIAGNPRKIRRMITDFRHNLSLTNSAA